MQKFIPAPACIKQKIELSLHNTEMLFYHTRIPFDRSIQSLLLENIHPFVFDQRYVCMHNGLISFKKNASEHILPVYKNQVYGTTDSELFFALWLSILYKTNNVPEALRKTLSLITDTSLLNIVMYDKITKNLYVYRGSYKHTDVPPLYLTRYGVTNFRIKEKYEIIPKNTLMIRSVEKDIKLQKRFYKKDV